MIVLSVLALVIWVLLMMMVWVLLVMIELDLQNVLVQHQNPPVSEKLTHSLNCFIDVSDGCW